MWNEVEKCYNLIEKTLCAVPDALCVRKGGENHMKRRMFVWMLSVVFVFSMLSLTLAQETKPAGSSAYR